MKVVHFTTQGEYKGGGVLCLFDVIKHEISNNIEPVVIIKHHGDTEEKCKELGVKYKVIYSYDWLYRVMDNKSTIHKFLGKIKQMIKLVVNFIAEIRTFFFLLVEQPDLYHINCIYNGCGAKSANLLKIPVVWHIREFSDNHPITAVFNNSRKAFSLMSHSKKIVAVSKCIEEYYSGKISNVDFVTIYDGIDLKEFNLSINDIFKGKEINIVMACSLTAFKGAMDAVLAVKSLVQLGHHNICLKIYGRDFEDEYSNNIKKIIEENDLSSNIYLMGYCDDLNEIWSDADIALNCSRSEAFGRVTVEAALKGIPVVGADNTGTEEIVSLLGLLEYKTGDVCDLTEKILSIINNKEKYITAQGRVQSKAIELFVAETNTDRLIRLFDEVLE